LSIPVSPPAKPATSSLQRLPYWLPLLILAATITILFYRLLLGDVLFWGLPSLQFEPWRAFAFSELQAGRLPLWNPFNGAGAPLFANYQSALLYLPNLIALLIPGGQALGWIGMLHLLWAGLGMGLYLRELGLPTFPRAIGLLAYALNGAVVARFGTPPMVAVAAWLPWLMLAIERLIRRRTLIDVSLLALVVTLQLLAGHAQWAFYSLTLAAVYSLFRVFITDRPRDKPYLPLLLIGAGVALGFAMAAVQLLPTAELQRQSQRAESVETSFALNFSYQWPSLLTQINPSFFGNPGDGTYVIGGEYFETASYIGIVPLCLALLAIGYYVRNRRRLNPAIRSATLATRLIPFYALITLGAFVLALGRNSPVFMFLFDHVPTFNLFQAPARWLLLAAFSLSVLAAIGASLWKFDRLAQRRARLWLASAVAITLSSGGVLLWLSAQPSATSTTRVTVGGVLTIGLQMIAAALIFLWQPRDERLWRRWAIGVMLFVAADMWWSNALSNPTVPASFYDPRSPITQGRTFTADDTINKVEFDQFLLPKDYRVAVQRQADYRAAGFPNMNLLDRQPSFNTFEPLRPAGIDHFTQLLSTQLLSQHSAPNLYAAAAIPQGTTPTPRVWLTVSAIATQDPFGAMRDPRWQPYNTALLELPDNTDSAILPTGTTGSAVGSVQIDHETPLELDLSTDSAAPAALVVADSWYPGWTARIDGTLTTIYRANGAFRAILLSGGKHTVIMRYEPAPVRTGALISLAAIIGWAALLYVSRRRTLVIRHSAQSANERLQ